MSIIAIGILVRKAFSSCFGLSNQVAGPEIREKESQLLVPDTHCSINEQLHVLGIEGSLNGSLDTQHLPESIFGSSIDCGKKHQRACKFLLQHKIFFPQNSLSKEFHSLQNSGYVLGSQNCEACA
jgi:hypothetical protein